MILEFYRQLVEEQMATPVLLGFKSEKERFVGALYTTTLEAMMPDGRAIQMGTSHNLGQNFSKSFEIKFLGQDEQTHYAWTTSWGVSWRLISAMIMLHSDDKGLVIPPRIAPIQIVIIPIYYKSERGEIIAEKVRSTADQLTKAGLAVHVDSREQYTPGWKFNEWELKGVPLRIEIGPKDVEKKQVILVRRDNLQKLTVEDDAIVSEVQRCLDEIQKALFSRAKSALNDSISQSSEYEQFKKTLNHRGGFVRACWCGRNECEEAIKTETGATIRTIPLIDEKPFSGCIYCENPAAKVAYFAKSY